MPFVGFLFLSAAVYLYFSMQENGGDSSPAEDAGLISDISSAAESVVSMIGETMTEIFTLPGSAAPYVEAITKAENDNGIPPGMLGRLLYQESRFRPDIITGKKRSPVGALGIAQFMPATAAEMGIDPLNPYAAIPAAAQYLRRLYDALGDWGAAVAAYNWGIGNVRRKGLSAMPSETRDYVAFVFGNGKTV